MKTLIQRLLTTHRALDREVSYELAQPLPDQLRLARLKKQRLFVKDRLAFVRAKANDVGEVAREMLAKRRTARG